MSNLLMLGLTRRKKIMAISIISIIYAVSMILILDAHINLGTYYNTNDPVDTDLIYDLETGDYFVYNSSQSQNMFGNITIGNQSYAMYQNGTWDYLRMREIVNNTNFVESSIEYCNVTYDESIGLLQYNFTNNEIIDFEDNLTLIIRMEIPIALKIQNYMPMLYINFTSGNATNIQVEMNEIEWGSIFDDDLGNATITLDSEFEGVSYFGIQIGDTFDILPYDNNTFPESIYYPEVDAYFLQTHTGQIIANATLAGLFQQPLAFPFDLKIEDIIQNGSGLLKTFFLMFSGSEELSFGNFFGDNDWQIEDSFNDTIANIYSDKEGGYIFNYIENGFNDTEDLQYNMTISINLNISLTERNVLDDFNVLMQVRDTLSNRTTSQSLFDLQVSMGIRENLVYSNIHYNDIELVHDNSALINENATINVTITDSRVTALLYYEHPLIPQLLNTFTYENQSFNVSYSNPGNYTFILEVYHDDILYETLEFGILFEGELPPIPLDWIYIIVEILLTIATGIGIFYILKYL